MGFEGAQHEVSFCAGEDTTETIGEAEGFQIRTEIHHRLGRATLCVPVLCPGSVKECQWVENGYRMLLLYFLLRIVSEMSHPPFH
jgi:hypothetical protein